MGSTYLARVLLSVRGRFRQRRSQIARHELLAQTHCMHTYREQPYSSDMRIVVANECVLEVHSPVRTSSDSPALPERRNDAGKRVGSSSKGLAENKQTNTTNIQPSRRLQGSKQRGDGASNLPLLSNVPDDRAGTCPPCHGTSLRSSHPQPAPALAAKHPTVETLKAAPLLGLFGFFGASSCTGIGWHP